MRPGTLNHGHATGKMRSGKIMRRLLRDVIEGRALGDTSALVDPVVFESIRASKSED
jgi:acetyl-CoA synthetase